MIFNELKFEFAMARKMGQESNRAAFFDPELKPAFFISFFDMRLLVNESSMTLNALKPLFLLFGFAIALN